MSAFEKEISSNTIDIEFNDIAEEISNLYEHQKNFFIYIKDNIKSKSKKKGIKFTVLISDSLTSPNVAQITGYKIKIEHLNNDKSQSIILYAYDNNFTIYSKEIIIPKTIDINETLKNFDKIIFKENIITNLKLLIDKINDITKSKFNNKLNTREVTELLESYKTEFEELKGKYKNILKSRKVILDLKKGIDTKNDVYINKLNQYFFYYNTIFLKEYNKLLKSSKESLDYSNYFRLSNIIGSNNSQEDETNVKFFNQLTQNYDFGTIVEDLDVNVKVIPFLEKTSITIPKDNIIEKNININIDTLKTYIEKSEYQNNITDFNQVLEKSGSDIITPKIIIKKYFMGNEVINPNLDEKVSSIIKSKFTKEDDIKIDNPDYSGPYNIIDLYDSKNQSYININYNISSIALNNNFGDIIRPEDIISKNFSNLTRYSDWRIKLDIFYINKDILSQEIIPIIIEKNHFASPLHYILYCKYYNRPDISGRKFTDYNIFANNLLLNKNGKYSKLWGKDLLFIEYKYNLQSHSRWNTIEDDIVKTALYAKFFQNIELKNILLSTREATLMTVLENSKIHLNYRLMEIRYMFNNDIKPTDFYNKYYLIDKQISEKIISELQSRKKPQVEKIHGFDFIEKLNDSKESIKSLYIKLNETINDENLIISKLPINKDTLYYSIVHGLYNIKRRPMLFGEENQYSNKIVFKNVSNFEEIYQPIFLEAAKNLRVELAEFYQKCIDEIDDSNIEFQHIREILDIDSIKFMASDGNEQGQQGNLNIILLASAMLNIDFNIYTTEDRKPFLINVNDTKKIFTSTSKYNETQTKINLGYLLDSNYILLNSKDYIDTLWNKKIYYIVELEHEGKKYKLATLNDETLNIVGIFDDETKKWGSSGNEDLDEILGQKMSEYWNSENKDPKVNKDITIEIYWINSDTNDVIHTKYGLNSIGKLVTEYDEDGSIETDIEFN